MNAYLRWVALTAVMLAVVSCAARTPAPATSAATAAQTPGDSQTKAGAPDNDSDGAGNVQVEEQGRAVIHTTEGDITVTFFPGVAPQTVAHIAGLMKAGCYQGVELFRLEPGFVLQVAPVANSACHEDAMSTVPAEFSQVKHQRLYLSMARWEDIDSGTSSWSIMLGPAPSMDGQYTVFGRVVAGEDTIAKIVAIGSTKGDDGMSRLNRPVSIQSVDITDMDAGDPADGRDVE